MAQSYEKIAIIGATGVLGQPLVKQLYKAGFDLTLVSRDGAALKQTFKHLDGVKVREADPEYVDSLKGVFQGFVLNYRW
jgi:uncharacterized protein YbjT (DUF2867 family)